MSDAAVLEAGSGKGADDENFPVASILLEPRHRPAVMTYYAFARAIDDIADHPELLPPDKLARLAAFGHALRMGEGGDGVDKATRLHHVMIAHDVPLRHGLDLVDAFEQDVRKGRYQSWDELIGYCERSAAPVGRFLLDLHGEARALWRHADALCNALQVINHLQDCGEDYRRLDRVYLPLPWLRAEGLDERALAADAAAPGLRRVLDRCLDGIDALLEEARPLAQRLESRRLALESGAIQAIAEALAARLRRRDPLAVRVDHGRLRFLGHAGRGLVRTAFQRLTSAVARAGDAA